ncbi:sialate O-acetylesterase [Cohnella sp. 56]|uniref:sialate O-acetylesterase n=1 Tax=Cohnella sp. 56 TaxID=3113722 RepID=UPI0030EAEC91
MGSQIGVIIEQGPQAWQILQQHEGAAVIEASGMWEPPDSGAVGGQVYARVVQEATSEIVVPWRRAEMPDGDRTWRIRLEGVPCGGLYRFETSLQVDGNPAMEWNVRGDMIHHLGVGDLWVIAGQSNASGFGKGPVSDPPEPGIHLLRNSGRWDLATHPFNESTATVHAENREMTNPGHSPYLSFARLVKRETGWPIGLVQTALGASPLSKWNPEEDGTLYRMMLEVVASVGGSVRGVLWYQGCSDCGPNDSQTYLSRFGAMVDRWRRDCLQEELPFLTVQLNRHTVPNSPPEFDVYWGSVREQQRRAARVLPHVAVVPALDCPLSDEIHNSPAGNLLIGERLARAALSEVYGRPIHYRAPEIAAARIVSVDLEEAGATIELTFVNVAGYLLPTGPLDRIFTVEDAEGRIPVKQCEIVGRNAMKLTLTRAIRGESRLHGAFERNPIAHLPVDSDTYMPLLGFYEFPISPAQADDAAD